MSKSRSRGSVKSVEVPAAAAADGGLSPGKDSVEHAMWREAYSIDGKRYFYHIFSRESQWEEPGEPWEPARVRSARAAASRSRTTSIGKQATQNQSPASPRVPRFPVLSGQSPGSPRLQRTASSPMASTWQDGQPATPRSASSSSLRSSGTLSAARDDGLAALLTEFDEFSQEFLNDFPGSPSSAGSISSPVTLPRSSSSPTVSLSEALPEPRTQRGASVSIGAQSTLPVMSGSSALSSPSLSRRDQPPPAAVPNKAGSPYRKLPSPPTVVASPAQPIPEPPPVAAAPAMPMHKSPSATVTFFDRPIGMNRSGSAGNLLVPPADGARRLSGEIPRPTSPATAPFLSRSEDILARTQPRAFQAVLSADDRARSVSDASRLEQYLRDLETDVSKDETHTSVVASVSSS